MRVPLIIIFVSLLLIKCDVPGRIEIVNRTSDHATYRYIYQNENSLKDTVNIYLTGQNQNKLAM